MSRRGWLDERAAQRAVAAFTHQDTAERDRVAELAAEAAADDGREAEARAVGRGWSM
ncbi:MAG: hypothetical protein ACREER_10640 [Alphaproteobacteria bacterium]